MVLVQSCQHCGTVCASVWIVQTRSIKLDAFVKDCERCMILWVRFGERDIGMYECMYVCRQYDVYCMYVCMYVQLLQLRKTTYIIGK